MLNIAKERSMAAARDAIVLFCAGRISRAECERTLRAAGWTQDGIKRHLDIAELNLKGVGHERT